MSATTIEPQPTMYFGYGSNLWREQMLLRCPFSRLTGIGRLPGYRWLINDRGYANIVPSTQAKSEKVPTEVYGLVYRLTPSDECTLDKNEGVPYAYTKELLQVDFWAIDETGGPIDVTKKAEEMQMLVYIDRERTKDSHPKKEYICRINKGIEDGAAQGIPQAYFDKSVRNFIPIEEAKDLEPLVRQQALRFHDEK